MRRQLVTCRWLFVAAATGCGASQPSTPPAPAAPEAPAQSTAEAPTDEPPGGEAPADPATPPEPEAAPPTEQLTAPPAAVCASAAVPACKSAAGAISVPHLRGAKGGGTVRVLASIQRGDTMCTRSVPPSCSTTLEIIEAGTHVNGRKSNRSVMLVGKRCGGSPECCDLVEGTTYVITGEHVTRPSAVSGGPTQHELRVTDVCKP